MVIVGNAVVKNGPVHAEPGRCEMVYVNVAAGGTVFSWIYFFLITAFFLTDDITFCTGAGFTTFFSLRVPPAPEEPPQPLVALSAAPPAPEEPPQPLPP